MVRPAPLRPARRGYEGPCRRYKISKSVEKIKIFWCARQDLNLRLPDPQSGVLSRLNYGRTMMSNDRLTDLPTDLSPGAKRRRVEAPQSEGGRKYKIRKSRSRVPLAFLRHNA